MQQAIHTTNAPEAIGPYSQAVEAGGMLFVSGQLPVDPGTGNLSFGDVEAQTSRVLSNLGAILKAAGYGFGDVVKTTVYLSDMADFQHMNTVYASVFTHKPARSTVEVSALPRNARIEIDAIACR